MDSDLATGGSPQSPTKAQHVVVAGLLCALTCVIYFQVHDHAFIEYDDPIYITENPNLAAGFNSQAIVRAFSEAYETNWIPLTWISYHFDYALFGLEPGGYQLVNATLHAISAVLLYFAIFGMTAVFGPSVFVAAVFAVHPVHVESVAWAAERKDTLSGVFWMLTLLAYSRYANRPSCIAGTLVFLAFTLGLLAKPMLVSLPLVLLLLDYWPLQRLARGQSGGVDTRSVRRVVAEKLPLFVIAGVVAWITIVVQDNAGAMANEAQVPFGVRLSNALVTCWIYLADSLWPSGLAIFYPHPMEATSTLLAGVAAIGLVATTGLCVWTARSHPHLIVGWGWYLVTLIPVIGLIQVGMQARADRYLYLPQIGLSLALAWSAREAFPRTRNGRLAAFVAGSSAVIALTAVAWRQTSYWRDTATLYTHALEVTSENFLAHQGLAFQLLDSGDPAAAQAHFERAIAIKPRWPAAHRGLGDARIAQGNVAAALADYRRAIDLAPRKAEHHLRFAIALEEHGKTFRATQHYLRAIALSEQPNAYAHARLAALYARTSQLVPAEAQYRIAVDIDPSYAEAHANLAFLLIRTQRFREARGPVLRAEQLGLDSAELHAASAAIALEFAEAAEAVRQLRRAVEMRPEWSVPANNLAWLLATHPDPDIRDPLAAVRFAEGLRRSGERLKPDQLDTLAAAYAAAGRFREAEVTASSAARLARDAGQLEFAQQIDGRLRLYRARRPFIEARPHGGR